MCFMGQCEERKQEASSTSWIPFVVFTLRQLKRADLPDEEFLFTWYWIGALRANVPRLKEFPSRLYHRVLVGDAWGNWRLMIGGRVADFVRCFDAAWFWISLKLVAWSSDLDRLASPCELIRIVAVELCNWSVLMMAPLSGDDFRSFLLGRGGLIEIFDEGGDESNREKRRNIFALSKLDQFTVIVCDVGDKQSSTILDWFYHFIIVYSVTLSRW